MKMVLKRWMSLMLAVLMVSICLGAWAEEAEEEAQPVVAVNEAYLMLASAAKPLSPDYEPANLEHLVSRHNDLEGKNENDGVYLASSRGVQLVKEAAEALTDMMHAADTAGIILYARQGYRSYEDEVKRYERMKDHGASEKPGETDYQTGLAVTIVNKAWRTKTLTEEFGQTEEAQWVAQNCARYGFVLRYPEGKQHITGCAWEPWHLRYVGDLAADIMQLNHLCLEEFLEGVGLSGECVAAKPVDQDALAEAVEGSVEAAQAQGLTVLEDIPFETPEILPPGPLVLDQTGPDGDNEIVLFHD